MSTLPQQSPSLVDIDAGDGRILPLVIKTVGYCSQREMIANIKRNIKRDVTRFVDLPLWQARPNCEPLAICGGGPSLGQYADKIKGFSQVMACGSAHDHLVDLGITPSFALAVDANADAVDYYSKASANTSYLIASHCHPNLFDRVEGFKRVAMWHLNGQVDDISVYNGEPQINWGSMVGVMSIQMALFLGFQYLHFFGFDCSYIGDDHHAYTVGKYNAEVEDKRLTFKLKGRPFESTHALIGQIEQLFQIFASEDGMLLKCKVYGDGLWANMIKESPPEMADWLEAVDARGA